MPKGDDRLTRRLQGIKHAAEGAPPAMIAKKAAKHSRRAADRATAFKFAILILEDQSQMKCVVANLSKTGAKVQLEGAIAVSPTVTLRIEAMGATHRCEVAWQNDAEVGLKFAS